MMISRYGGISNLHSSNSHTSQKLSIKQSYATINISPLEDTIVAIPEVQQTVIIEEIQKNTEEKHEIEEEEKEPTNII